MRRDRKIVAIGGGELGTGETLPIDRRIVELTGKRRPRALFVPTASSDSPRYVRKFEQVYGRRLGCAIDVLRLCADPPSRRQISAAVMASDLVYVGGGNTYRMMRTWRRLGVDAILVRAATRGIVLSGLSAGAICWFSHGLSDSFRARDPKRWDYIRLRGLGLIDLLYCPHVDVERRRAALRRAIARRGGVAVACDDRVALEIIGDTYRVLRSSQAALAYRGFKARGKVVLERIEPTCAPEPLAALLDR